MAAQQTDFEELEISTNMPMTAHAEAKVQPLAGNIIDRELATADNQFLQENQNAQYHEQNTHYN